MPVAQKKKRVWPLLNEEDDDEDGMYDMDDRDTMVGRKKKLKHLKHIQERLYKPSKKRVKKPGLVKKTRPHSAPSHASRTAKEMWMEAVKERRTYGLSADGKPCTPRCMTPVEYWINTLRTTGEGISTESTGMQLMGKHKADYSYLSTTNYLRHMMGAEKLKSTSESSMKVGGTPAYKSPEDYYDEHLDLRKKISAYDAENVTLKVKLRNFEKELLKKDKQLDRLQKLGTRGDMSSGDKHVESSNLVISLKQKITRLESQIRERELAHAKLTSDIKTTKIDELRLQMETFYQEVMRLQNLKGAKKSRILTKGTSKEGEATIASLKENIMRINKEKENLQKENLLMKDELNESGYFKHDIKKDYEDMNRKQLLATIVKLEKKLKLSERRGSLDDDRSSVRSLDLYGKSSRDFSGKIELEGSVQERLDQLDKRETQLLDEVKRLKSILKRLKEDKSYFKKKVDLKEKNIKELRKGYRAGDDSRRRARPGSASSRSSSPRSARGHTNLTAALKRIRGEDPLQYRRLKDFVRNHAARTIQREWRTYHHDDYSEREDRLLRNKAMRTFVLNRSARKIQNEWRDHNFDKATLLIRSVMHGNDARRRRLNQMGRKHFESEPEDSEDESTSSYSGKSMETHNATDLIRNSLFGHRSREKRLKTIRKRLYSDDAATDSQDEDSDEDVFDSENDSDTKQYKMSSRSSDKLNRSFSSRNSLSNKRPMSSLERRNTGDRISSARSSISDHASSFHRPLDRSFTRASSRSSMIERPSSSRADDRRSSHRNSAFEIPTSTRSNRSFGSSLGSQWKSLT